MKAAAARRAAAEALGTFFLVLIGPGAVMVNAYSGGAVSHVGVALAFALVVLAMVYALGLLSFVLMFVIMAVATDRRVADGFAAIAVGLTVGFCAMVGGPLTGASMNSARSLGPAVAGGFWHGHWLYWIAPITAMMAAARIYDGLRHVEPPQGVAEAAPLGVQGPIKA